MATTEIGRPGAKLVLPGTATGEATVEVIYQSRATRASRALITLAVAILISPVLFFLPPRFLWPIVALAAGGYLAWRYWNGEYYVTGFKGRCPRCETPLELARGTRIRDRHSMECSGCHSKPTLVLDDPEHLADVAGRSTSAEAEAPSEAESEPESEPESEAGAEAGDRSDDRRSSAGDRRSAPTGRRTIDAGAARIAPETSEPAESSTEAIEAAEPPAPQADALDR